MILIMMRSTQMNTALLRAKGYIKFLMSTTCQTLRSYVFIGICKYKFIMSFQQFPCLQDLSMMSIHSIWKTICGTCSVMLAICFILFWMCVFAGLSCRWLPFCYTYQMLKQEEKQCSLMRWIWKLITVTNSNILHCEILTWL